MKLSLILLINIILIIVYAQRNPDKIIGREKANKDQFPFFVQLRDVTVINKTYTKYYYCGATLISEHWILSAAHCFPNNAPKREIVTFLGSMKSFDPQAQQLLITEVRRHPDYFVEFYSEREHVVRNINFDVAVAKLAKPAILSKSVQPIVLASGKSSRWFFGCTNGIILGIGKSIPYGNISDYVYYPKIRRKRKFQIYGGIPEPNFPTAFYTEVEIGTKHTAIGDSGGPFICPNERPIMAPVQHGIISHEFRDTNWRTVTTTFEDVPELLEFILEHVPNATLNNGSEYGKTLTNFLSDDTRNIDNYKGFLVNSRPLKGNSSPLRNNKSCFPTFLWYCLYVIIICSV